MNDDERLIAIYLDELCAGLDGYADTEVHDIRREVECHILDRCAAGENSTDRILRAMGRPDVLRRMYLIEQEAELPTTPRRTPWQRPGFHFAGLTSTAIALIGYGAAVVLLACAVLKPFLTDAIGIWWGRDVAMIGSYAGTGATELVGWWLIPIGIIGAGSISFVTGHALRLIETRRMRLPYPAALIAITLLSATLPSQETRCESEDVAYSYQLSGDPSTTFAAHETRNDPTRLTIAGTLSLPESNDPLPAVLLISGSGPQNRDEELFGHKPFLVLTNHLTRHGIAVLRVDDRGVGQSTGSFASGTTMDFADDARAGLNYLLSRPEVDSDRIGLIGHSEGGGIAAIVAATDPSLAFIIMMAGPGVAGRDIIRLQDRQINAANGDDQTTIDAKSGLLNQMIEAIDTEQDATRLKRRLDVIATKAWLLESSSKSPSSTGKQDYVDRIVRLQSSRWFRYAVEFDAAEFLRKIECSILVINGAKDLQVDPDQNLPVIHAAVMESDCIDYTIVKLPDLNHVFQTCVTGSPSEYGRIEETIAPIALRTITDWIALRF